VTCDVQEGDEMSTNTSQPGWGRAECDRSLILHYCVVERNSWLERNGGLKRRLTDRDFP